MMPIGVVEAMCKECRDLREKAEVLLEIYSGEPHQKDRLYDLFVTYDGSRYSVICPLCGWRSAPLDAGSRLEYFNTVARVLASHAHSKHGWARKYKRYPRRFWDGERVLAAETEYKCTRCGAMLPNFLMTVLHEIAVHGWEDKRAEEVRGG